jgi:caffeoyl-CoA O-methyltransferase
VADRINRDIVNPEVEAYAEAHTTPMPTHLATLEAETKERFQAWGMMVGTLEGRYLEMLVFATQPRLVLEIGTFTGYSSLAMAAALPAGGRIITCDINEEHLAVARRHIEASPYADRIEIKVGPAIDTIATLDGPFDLVFIDADKTGYAAYFEAVLPKLAPTGIIAVDNTLWSGRVVATGDRADDSPDTLALRAFNDAVVADERVICVQTTVRDGVTLIRQR